MLVKEYLDSTELENLSGDLLGIDLELANSFQSEPSVICMIGLQRYDPQAKTSLTTIATITRRDEEEALMRALAQFGHDSLERCLSDPAHGYHTSRILPVGRNSRHRRHGRRLGHIHSD